MAGDRRCEAAPQQFRQQVVPIARADPCALVASIWVKCKPKVMCLLTVGLTEGNALREKEIWDDGISGLWQSSSFCLSLKQDYRERERERQIQL